MKKYLILVFLFWLSGARVEAAEFVSYEMPRTQVIPIQDTQAGKQYELYVRLPENYGEDPEARHPVIYYTDAVWHIDLLSAATVFLMENAILVGISWQKDMSEELKKKGAHISRAWDYSVRPASDPKRQAKYKFGQAGNHMAFIRKDVIPYVERNYRTQTDNRSYFGYSMGGVFGAYVLLAQPDTFKNYILGSPALDGDIPAISKLAASSPKSLNANVFVSYGSLEKELAEYGEEFVNLLKNRNDKSLVLEQRVIEGNHQRAAPLTGVQAVAWLSELKGLSGSEQEGAEK
ncbi:alpha/beta hydrolase [Pseudoteredinibacter isoporae]|uniref:Alpha/beta hydrolase n=1 Tax=Pseudoteredinibacter isoporae TaxID=570281 RepID=A0A7X0JWZ4_9GAMM|nr:alpha/beta hydrolase-fold protein [Pseudoteredinibacter isoporae]MBB6523797.1 hypothetical protein [Pseudoteredinibacter isoporae]NHO89317.1 alpha/beta hydrolase [Pseudoteredinibacter isoporae]NIB22424.1 alpha/beta hydrolase [Pseudoteredinibacter isoporae]